MIFLEKNNKIMRLIEKKSKIKVILLDSLSDNT